MCTSFIHRGGPVLVGMNLDNAAPYAVKKSSRAFVVQVQTPRGWQTSFGVTAAGVFANSLYVDANGLGLYKRPAKGRDHVTGLVEKLLTGRVPPEDIDRYLLATEVVNPPDFALHSMITDRAGNAWAVEPGRGLLRSMREESPFFVMTNFSLLDAKASGKIEGDGAARYQKATQMLAEADSLTVSSALRVLRATAQTGGDMPTEFSMVYAAGENAVYYCLDGDFFTVQKHEFAADAAEGDTP